jgi:hypothetical protein
LVSALVGACAGTPVNPSHGAPVGTTACNGETRQQIDCASEVSYQGVSAQGSLKVGTFASGRAKYEETALRRVDEETERYLAMQGRLCRDYNACALDKETYQKESRRVRDRLRSLPEMRDALSKATTDDDKQKAVDALYRALVPADKRVEEVAVSLGVEADLPNGKHVQLRQGGALPTDAKVAFNVQVSADAYVYIFQSSPDGSVAVLFPNDKIGTKNPLAGGALSRIPPGHGSFRLNDKDVGTEKVFIAVSRKELAQLNDALARVNAGQVTSMGGDPTLKELGSVGPSGAGKKCGPAPAAPSKAAALPPPAASGGPGRPGDAVAGTRGFELFDDGSWSGGCPRPRGLELADGGDAGVPAATVVARTEPGDSLIVKVFTFEHLTAQAFAAKGGN